MKHAFSLSILEERNARINERHPRHTERGFHRAKQMPRRSGYGANYKLRYIFGTIPLVGAFGNNETPSEVGIWYAK